MTSPPYWGLRDYGVEGQLGLEKHPQEYIDKLVAIFQDIKRVLSPHGSFFLNLGDTYCSMKGACKNAGGSVTSVPQPAFKALNGTSNPNRMLRPDGGWLQPKQLLMIPARVAIAMQDDGWILRNDVIWNKPNGLPSSVKDRLSNKYEHLFHFVKSRKYFYDLDAIRVPHESLSPQGRSLRTSEGRTSHTARRLMGLRNAGAGYIGHVGGKNPGDVVRFSPETRRLGALVGKAGAVKVPGGKGWIGHPAGGMARIVRERDPRWLPERGKNPGDFLRLGTRPFRGAHFAVYPERLCERPIKAACPGEVCTKCGTPRWKRFAGRSQHAFNVRMRDVKAGRITHLNRRASLREIADYSLRSCLGSGNEFVGYDQCKCNCGFRPGIVFDPFAGAGTTMVVAKRLRRRFLGCELNRDYVNLAKKRIAAAFPIRDRCQP